MAGGLVLGVLFKFGAVQILGFLLWVLGFRVCHFRALGFHGLVFRVQCQAPTAIIYMWFNLPLRRGDAKQRQQPFLHQIRMLAKQVGTRVCLKREYSFKDQFEPGACTDPTTGLQGALVASQNNKWVPRILAMACARGVDRKTPHILRLPHLSADLKQASSECQAWIETEQVEQKEATRKAPKFDSFRDCHVRSPGCKGRFC